jgi:cytochrome c biogenesis protein CcmG/thiol:disulfide interchange protein DsbE
MFNMGLKIAILISLLVPLYFAEAEEVLPILKVNGETYTNVTVTKVSATDIYFTSTNGMGNAKLKDLDRKLQKHFHYSASKSRAVERQQADEAVQFHAQLMSDYPQPATGDTNSPINDANKRLWAKSFLNHQGPELQVERWLTGMPDCRGKFILYDFWDPTNAACRAEIPELNAFQNELSDRLVIIGISEQGEDAVKNVADQIIQYPIAIDTQARTENAVGVTALPHLMLMDPKGYVRWEGYPFLQGHEFSNKVLMDIIAQYDKNNP